MSRNPDLPDRPGSRWRRRVAQADADAAEACPWYQYLCSSLAFETHFSYSRPSNFSCADNRGDPGNDLFILNHFLTNNTGAPSCAQQVNHDFLLSARARECWEAQRPTPIPP